MQLGPQAELKGELQRHKSEGWPNQEEGHFILPGCRKGGRDGCVVRRRIVEESQAWVHSILGSQTICCEERGEN